MSIVPATCSTYEDAVAFLYARLNYERLPMRAYTPERMRLDRMERLLRVLGDPQLRVPTIHVAGTKGKGSTSAMIAESLRAAGYKTGLYTSPHLERIEERFWLDGQLISAETIVDLVNRVLPIVAQFDAEGDGLTFFELVTAAAWLLFAEAGVEAAVIEVGLGGRLDSTNVCCPLVSVITSISIDHTKQLGSTLASIAAEKAGIIKPGVPVISGVLENEPAEVIAQIAATQHAPLYRLGHEVELVDRQPTLDPPGQQITVRLSEDKPSESLWIGLQGAHQARNAVVARAALDRLVAQGWAIDPAAIATGLANTQVAGRCEWLPGPPPQVLDVAHNAASVQAVLDTVAEAYPSEKPVMLLALSRDKDIPGILKALLPRVDRLVLTQYVTNPRALSVKQLEAAVMRLEPSVPVHRVDGSPAAAWQTALSLARPTQPVVITGSTFLIAELRPIIMPGGLGRPAV
jgi:dihydrofolate synthase/folylpolyglutamate synthase